LQKRKQKAQLNFQDELSLLFTGKKVSPETEVHNSLEEEERDEVGNDLVLETDAGDATITIGGLTIASHDNQDSRSAAPTNPPVIHPNLLGPLANCPPHPLFTTEQLGVDRRLIVNRKRQLKMYRVWMQGKFRKL
jgi:tRNAThr (cytosine32-N3)-methyltransferase